MPIDRPVVQRRLAVVLPVKPFGRAKSRLAPLLEDAERAGFARTMFLDVLTVVCTAWPPRHVFVVSACDEVAGFARQVGAQVVTEPTPTGVTPALALAAARVRAEGYDSMLALPTDVPLITVADVDRLVIALGEAPAVVLVPAAEGGGTNALACAPLDAIPYCFGESSLQKHRDSAAAAGSVPRVLRLERVGLDIDHPADVAAFLAHPASTRSRAYLRGVGVDCRLSASEAISSNANLALRCVQLDGNGA